METTTASAGETQKLGEKIAADLKGGEVFALVGDLGSGKTTFVQGFARELGVTQRIISPTFILIRKYEIPKDKREAKLKNFYHIDLYRLNEQVERELVNLGFKEIVEDPENVVTIEWADKAVNMFSRGAKWIEFKTVGKGKRRIKISKL